MACWAHARRKFFDARANYPWEAHQTLQWIHQFYEIEDRGRELSAEMRCELRRAEANPILDRINAYLTKLTLALLPKSALTYAHNQWDALRCYTTDGRLAIDNNTAERTLRHQAIGRRNWLFIGSENAGPRAVILNSIKAGAKRHRMEPWTYVRELLMRLQADESQLEDLLPDHWAAAHPEFVLSLRLEESRKKAATKKNRRQKRRTATPSTSQRCPWADRMLTFRSKRPPNPYLRAAVASEVSF